MSDKPLRYPAFNADGLTIVLYLALIAFGWVSICGASHELGDTDFLAWSSRSGKQMVWIGLALTLGFILLMTDDRYFEALSGVAYWLMMALLIVTPFLAKDIKGSRSWISLGAVNLQPAEFAKCATALAIARYIGRFGVTLSDMRSLMRASAIVLLPMVLIVMQRETGSALVYLAFFLMFYREGMPGGFLFTATAAIIYFVVCLRFAEDLMPMTLTPVGEYCVLLLIWLFTTGMARVYCPHTPHARRMLLWGGGVFAVTYLVSAFIVPIDVAWGGITACVGCAAYMGWQALGERIGRYAFIAIFALGSTAFLYMTDYTLNNILEPHQQTRVRVLLGIEENISGAGYNVNQSKIAIGSGGLEGKGFMNGTQTKLKYVPEQDTDFIFCTVGEEQGFIGSASVLLLFLALILRLIHLAERQSSKFGRVYGYCVLSILCFHVLINVGMVMGIMPVIGIPLPFFSYGGSSLWGFTLLLFIFLRIDAADRCRLR